MNIILRKLQDTDKATYFALAKKTWVNKKPYGLDWIVSYAHGELCNSQDIMPIS